MSVAKDDVSKQRIGWLRDRLLQQMEQVRDVAQKAGKVSHLALHLQWACTECVIFPLIRSRVLHLCAPPLCVG
jgi:hypothetical protein